MPIILVSTLSGTEGVKEVKKRRRRKKGESDDSFVCLHKVYSSPSLSNVILTGAKTFRL